MVWSQTPNDEVRLRVTVEDSPVGSSKRNGIVERAIQSFQGMVTMIRSSLEEK